MPSTLFGAGTRLLTLRSAAEVTAAQHAAQAADTARARAARAAGPDRRAIGVTRAVTDPTRSHSTSDTPPPELARRLAEREQTRRAEHDHFAVQLLGWPAAA